MRSYGTGDPLATLNVAIDVLRRAPLVVVPPVNPPVEQIPPGQPFKHKLGCHQFQQVTLSLSKGGLVNAIPSNLGFLT